MLRIVALFLMLAASALAAGPVYVVLWFDTEDYIQPASDDAALRIARDLSALGVRGVFKVVGEKARVLEQRKRQDVIRALAKHEIGYHTDFHSVPPTPAVYLADLGWLEGTQEFLRRERAGAADVRRIFGPSLSCYGQPGSSWAPQTLPALREMGIRVYLDEGSQVGLDSQPFWYGGLLHVFNMGRFTLRASLDNPDELPKTLERFDELASELSARGGGVISVYYHPCEFSTTEFWDGVNFSRGAGPVRSLWKPPQKRAPEESERRYGILRSYVQHALKNPAVRFVGARDLLELYTRPLPHVERSRIAQHMAERQTFLVTDPGALSAADMLQILLGMEPGIVDGPASRIATTVSAASVPRAAFENAKRDAVGFIRAHKRLPAAVWIGSAKLSVGDFAATLAADEGRSPEVEIHKANLEFEKYVATEARRSFGWVIHPAGFDGSALLEMGRLEAWTLKPARLK